MVCSKMWQPSDTQLFFQERYDREDRLYHGEHAESLLHSVPLGLPYPAYEPESQPFSYEIPEQLSLRSPSTKRQSSHPRSPQSISRDPFTSPQTFAHADDASAPDSWRQRQTPAPSALRRYPTRRINLVQGSVLSVDYPVPSAIRNAIQPKYRDAGEGFTEEFTHLRCKHLFQRSIRNLTDHRYGSYLRP